jgi:signal transduction histidine kinase
MGDERMSTGHGEYAASGSARLDLHRCTGGTLEQARRATAEELIALVAHDLRGYLTPLNGYISVLRAGAEREGRVRDASYARAAATSLAALARLTSRLLTAHRLEHGSFVPEARSLDLVAVVREAVDMVADPTALVHITAPEELLCSGDPDLLREAVANLLTNALHYTPPAVPVRVVIVGEDGGARATVQVSDQGPGIAPDLLPHLFERFTTGTGSTGLGLRLYLAREIARTHGGIVTVASAAGRGTTFRLTLPLPVAAGRATPGDPGAPAAAACMEREARGHRTAQMTTEPTSPGRNFERSGGGAETTAAACSCEET